LIFAILLKRPVIAPVFQPVKLSVPDFHEGLADFIEGLNVALNYLFETLKVFGVFRNR
jgi:hypothetical protein